MGNLFTEEGLELIAIHTKDVMDAAVVKDWKVVIQKLCEGTIRWEQTDYRSSVGK